MPRSDQLINAPVYPSLERIAGALLFFMGIGLLIPGKNAGITAGTVFSAFTDEARFISSRDQ